MLKKVFKKLLFYRYLILKINWIHFWRFYDSKASNVILVWPSAPFNIKENFLGSVFENDFALVQALIKVNKKFRIIVGIKSDIVLKNNVIFFNISKLFQFLPGKNYTSALQNFQNNLIAQGNKIVPSEYDTLFWENKIYMHKKFSELEISHPKTIVVDENNIAPDIPNLHFPILFKPAHSSGSTGIVKLNSIDEYKKVVASTTLKEYLLQEWIDMHKDLRLIFIGDELVLHYWRINNGNEWKPTSTGHGSSVDFDTLPTDWMPFIFKEYKKLNLHSGAFDITWPNDDLTKQPMILEVSPSYMPNPAPSEIFKNKSYSAFKKQIFGKDAYYKKYIDLVFDLKLKLIKEYEKY